MAKIVLISCSSKKSAHKQKAEDLYISPLFRLSLAYAKKLRPDKIFIFSAKHGLVNLNDKIAPYNETLNDKSVSDIKVWAGKVIIQLERVTNLENDLFIFLAGVKYRKYILPYVKNYKIPLKGLRIGEQLAFLKNEINN